MKKWLLRSALVLIAGALLFGAMAYRELRSMGLFRAPVYDEQPPSLPALAHPAVLVFFKTNGYIHRQAIPAANSLFQHLAADHGWSIYLTTNGAINNPVDLKRFDVIVWNNVTGDVLTPAQQNSFKSWLEGGGRWLGIHGSGGDWFDWTWFVDEVIAAKFAGHTLHPQIARAKVSFENGDQPMLSGLPRELWWTDELYSFSVSPRATVNVLATLDESTYVDAQPGFLKLRMGDHPIIWWRKVGNGTAIYSALGHTAEAYATPEYQRLLENSVRWLLQRPAGSQ